MARITRRHRWLRKQLRPQGCTVTLKPSGHLRIGLPDGGHLTTGSTPSDHRANKKLRADLKRHGLDLKGNE